LDLGGFWKNKNKKFFCNKKMGAQQTQHFDPTIEGWEKVDMIGGITTWARQATG
jgi:hypothetical protein